MKTIKIIVMGRVQKVGYRRLVDEIAYNLSINGYVKNLEDRKTVEMVAQHKDANAIKKFIEMIQIQEYPIKVEKVEKVETKEIESHEYETFEVIEGPLDIENRESIEAGAIYIRKLAGEMEKTREELGNKLDTFHHDTVNKFDILEQKYGKISATLERISVALEKLAGISK